jgi:hypothetical protein
MFRRHVEILEAKVTLPNLAREFFRGVVARELPRFPADELLSNQVRFVLRPSSRLRAHATAASYTLASIEWK